MDYKDYAEKYYQLGFNIACLSYLKTKYNINESNPEKAPCHAWIDLQIRKQNVEEIDGLPWEYATGIGCILGKNRIKCIDVDNCNDLNFIELFLKKLGLPQNYNWTIKTPNGFHVYILSENIYFSYETLEKGILSVLPNNEYKNKFSRIELRWAGNCILPPSQINGKQYKFLYENEIPDSIYTIRNINLASVYEVLCIMCGTHKYLPYSDTSPNVISGFKGQIAINDYTINVSWSSHGDLSFKQIRNDELIVYHTSHHSQNIEPKYKNRLKKRIFFDIETTGLISDPLDYSNYPRLIQIALIVEDSHGLRRYNLLAFPDDFIVTEEIENLTGITESELSENGVEIEKILNTINYLYDNDTLLIGHNIEFDLSILDAEFYRLGMRNKFRDLESICTMKTISQIDNSKYKSLSSLYEFLFEDTPSLKLHNAENDVEVLYNCYKLMELYGYGK